MIEGGVLEILEIAAVQITQAPIVPGEEVLAKMVVEAYFDLQVAQKFVKQHLRSVADKHPLVALAGQGALQAVEWDDFAG